MKVQLAPRLINKLKKQNVRIRKSFRKAIDLFSEDPNNSTLNSHELHGIWKGFRSIDVASDWRAVYQEIKEGKDSIAYFTTLGIHKQLYK